MRASRLPQTHAQIVSRMQSLLTNQTARLYRREAFPRIPILLTLVEVTSTATAAQTPPPHQPLDCCQAITKTGRRAEFQFHRKSKSGFRHCTAAMALFFSWSTPPGTSAYTMNPPTVTACWLASLLGPQGGPLPSVLSFIAGRASL